MRARANGDRATPIRELRLPARQTTECWPIGECEVLSSRDSAPLQFIQAEMFIASGRSLLLSVARKIAGTPVTRPLFEKPRAGLHVPDEIDELHADFVAG